MTFDGKRIGGLDLLRGICALSVFAFHILYLFPSNGTAPWPPVTWGVQYGYLGVPVFFMISGYVISLSAAGKTRRQFAIGRAARLLPAFWICLSLTAAALALSGSPATLAQMAANIPIVSTAFGQPYLDAVYWSLTAELLFYVAVLVLAIGPSLEFRLRWFTVAWLVWAVAHLVRSLPLTGLTDAAWAPYFALGIFAYLGQRTRRPTDWLLYGASVAVSVVAAWAQAVALARPQAAPSIAALIIGGSALVFLGATVLPVRSSPMSKLIGATSYPLYLIHAVLGLALISWAYRLLPWLALPAVIVVVTLAALITRAEPFLSRRIRRLG